MDLPEPTSPRSVEPSYASRGALKLVHALDTFGLDPRGLVCADLGCSTGGFTDVLLRRGAERVFAIDTAYGQLDYRLRVDGRVVVMERTNALHAEPPEPAKCPMLIVIDLGWTRQSHAIPAALRWLRDDPSSRVISLIKPHYEIERSAFEAEAEQGVLAPARAECIATEVAAAMPSFGAQVLEMTPSPVLGGAVKRGKRKGKTKGAGNVEYLALVAPTASRAVD
ncbi:MAG: SAM-dependent methyltransferase [Planctomycetota bacterium]